MLELETFDNKTNSDVYTKFENFLGIYCNPFQRDCITINRKVILILIYGVNIFIGIFLFSGFMSFISTINSKKNRLSIIITSIITIIIGGLINIYNIDTSFK